MEAGIAKRRTIIKRYPLSPKAHFELGSFLGMVGKRLWNRELINEGINECRIAAALRQDWDAPAVEVGIILVNTGYYEEALVELEMTATRLQRVTPHLAFSRGYAQMMLGQYKDALDTFEVVIGSKPDYALALNYAAHCSFMSGDRNKGIRYAKIARNLGEHGIYDAWRNGQYRKRNLENS